MACLARSRVCVGTVSSVVSICSVSRVGHGVGQRIFTLRVCTAINKEARKFLYIRSFCSMPLVYHSLISLFPRIPRFFLHGSFGHEREEAKNLKPGNIRSNASIRHRAGCPFSVSVLFQNARRVPVSPETLAITPCDTGSTVMAMSNVLANPGRQPWIFVCFLIDLPGHHHKPAVGRMIAAS